MMPNPVLSSMCLFVGVVLLIAHERSFNTILAEVNKLLPEEEKIKYWQVHKRAVSMLILHSEFYPNSPKRKQMWGFILVGFPLVALGLAALTLK
jgi:hypothetical protein